MQPVASNRLFYGFQIMDINEKDVETVSVTRSTI